MNKAILGLGLRTVTRGDEGHPLSLIKEKLHEFFWSVYSDSTTVTRGDDWGVLEELLQVALSQPPWLRQEQLLCEECD